MTIGNAYRSNYIYVYLIEAVVGLRFWLSDFGNLVIWDGLCHVFRTNTI